jgi:fatty-acid desaturase
MLRNYFNIRSESDLENHFTLAERHDRRFILFYSIEIGRALFAQFVSGFVPEILLVIIALNHAHVTATAGTTYHRYSTHKNTLLFLREAPRTKKRFCEISQIAKQLFRFASICIPVLKVIGQPRQSVRAVPTVTLQSDRVAFHRCHAHDARHTVSKINHLFLCSWLGGRVARSTSRRALGTRLVFARSANLAFCHVALLCFVT